MILHYDHFDYADRRLLETVDYFLYGDRSYHFAVSNIHQSGEFSFFLCKQHHQNRRKSSVEECIFDYSITFECPFDKSLLLQSCSLAFLHTGLVGRRRHYVLRRHYATGFFFNVVLRL